MKIKNTLQLIALSLTLSLTLSSCASLLGMAYKIAATKADKIFEKKGYEMTGDMVCKREKKDVPSQFKTKNYIKCSGTTKDNRRAEFNGGELLKPDSAGHKSHFHGLINGKKAFLDYGEEDI